MYSCTTLQSAVKQLRAISSSSNFTCTCKITNKHKLFNLFFHIIFSTTDITTLIYMVFFPVQIRIKKKLLMKSNQILMCIFHSKKDIYLEILVCHIFTVLQWVLFIVHSTRFLGLIR